MNTGDDASARPPVVDFARTGRRLVLIIMTLAAGTLVTWFTVSVISGTFELRRLGEYAGWAALLAVAAEMGIVAATALAGMLRAGGRGHRLASDDVSLIPPQLRRRRSIPHQTPHD